MIPEAADLSPWHAVPDSIAWTLHCHFASNPSKGPNTTQKQVLFLPSLQQLPFITAHVPRSANILVFLMPSPAESMLQHTGSLPLLTQRAEQMRWEGMLKAGEQQEDLGLGFWSVWGAFGVHFLFGDFLLFLTPSREVAYKTWQTHDVILKARHQQEL